jgi:hypothetical protein
MNTSKNIVNVEYGNSKFSFTTIEFNCGRVFFHVYIKQVTMIDGEPFTITHKICAKDSKSEFAAINYAGNKMIKNWVNIR